jgi:hypothetical protein
MADYNIKAEITADASGFESGIKKAQKASKNLSSTVSGVVKGLGKSGLVGALGAVGLASAGVSAVLGTVVKVAKKVAQTVDECSQAYRKQYQAEIALTTAVNNNPYVDGTATKRLKEFASEMQRVSDIGDEELLPMMADLIAKGRTEDETMQIMSVALDMSAGGAMSLDTAITQLNATLNGNVGRLGQQNAELKDLTEEELKQGKAVEILGAKYKGLAQATADSQKQLRNAIGDLKENIGQIFEQALSPMRKFFTEVITNLNNSITKSRELKTAMKEAFGDNGEVNIGASTDALNTAFTEVLHKQQEVTKNYQQYIQLYGKYIDVATDETALSYRSQIADLNAQLKAISEELDKRRKESEEEKRKLAQAKADEEAKKELEKQKEIREKELAIEKEWADKLFNIRIENLERQRDLELENEELTEEQRIAISDFYGEQILAMKIKQIEKERDEALQGENVTEEAREKIRLYYENKITQAKQDESKKRVKATKQEVKEEKKDFEQLFATIKRVGETITDAFKNTFSKMKSVAGKIGNVLKSVFEFNADDALDNLLVFEDKILTFFVETLPKLPNFFASAIQSISVLFKSLGRVIDFNVISDILKTIVQGVSDWVSGGGWKDLLDLVLALQMAVEKAVEENIDLVVETLEKMLPDLVTTLTKSIVSASQTLGKIAKVLLPLVAKIINAIVDVITSNEVVQSSVEAVEGIVEGLIPAIVDILIKAGPKLSNLFSFKLPLILPQMIVTVITAIINAIEKLDFSDLVDAMFDGFMDALDSFSVTGLAESLMKLFKKTMSLDFWINVLSNFATAIGTLLMNTVQTVFQNPSKLITGSSSSGGGTTSSGNSTASVVTSAILTGGLSLLWKHANGTNATHRGLAIVGEAGPEIVNFRGGEQVLNNRNTNKALAEMGGKTNNFNVTFNNLQDTTAFNMMQQLKAYNRQMAINGVI